MSRFQRLFRRRQGEKDLDEEVETHLRLAAQDRIARGEPPEQARAAVAREFGNLALVKEVTRDMWGWTWLEQFLQDVRYGLRMLAKSPGFTAAAVLTLALGIGANTAIFSLLNAVLLRRLPVREPDQLVEIFSRDRNGRSGQLSFPLFEAIEPRQRVFSGMFAWWGDGIFNVEANGTLTRGDLYCVTENFYSELGVTPLMGRLLTASDVNLRGGSPASVAVLGYGFWQRIYGGDAAVLGKTVRVEGIPFTVVGVTRQGFKGMSLAAAPDVTLPLTAEPMILLGGTRNLGTRSAFWVAATGRLMPGVTLAQARSQVGSFWRAALEETVPPEFSAPQRSEYLARSADLESAANGMDYYLRAHLTRPLYFLAGIAGLILLIACVNLASLMLARAAGRNHEMGVRVALGASRGRLARQLLTESVLLSVLGATLGLGFAWQSSVALKNLITGNYAVPSTLNVSPDPRVLGFTAALAILAGVLFGLAPVWQVARRTPLAALRENSRTLANPAGRLGKGLICLQVATSVVLLMGAGLFVRSLEKLSSIDPGIATQGVLDLQLFPRPHGYDNLDNFTYYSQLLERVSSLPGVSGAGLSHFRPAGGYEWQESVAASSAPADPGMKADLAWVTPGFFEALSIRLMGGRAFNLSDNEHSARVAILSKSLARRLFPAGEALGHRVNIGADPKWQNLEVVGIAADARLYDVRNPNTFIAYVDALQVGDLLHWSELEVRTAAGPAAATGAVSNVVDSLGHEYVLSARTLGQVKDGALLNERLTAMLSELFGGLALLLVATGLYGLMSYSVAGRTREMGIRMALGARPAGILWMVWRETLALVALGLLIGIPAAWLAARLIAHMVYGLSPHDPLTFAAVLLVLVAVTTIAGYFPARRATRVDPLRALRHE